MQKKSVKGKVDNYFGTSSDLSNFSDDNIFPSEKPKKKSTFKKTHDGSYTQVFKGKIQNLFFRDEMHKHQIRSSGDGSNVDCPDGEDCESKDYVYLQMKLIKDQFTPELEAKMDKFRKEGISIRQAQPTDIPILTRLYNRSFMMGSDPWSPLTEENMMKILASSTGILIGSIGEEDVGFIITDIEKEEAFLRGVICGLGTEPRWQRRGIAKFLSVSAWDYLRKQDVDEILCEVYENNKPSYNLIKSVHFQEYGKKTYQF